LTFDSGSLETLIQLVRNGAGYTLLPHLALSNLSAAEKKKYIKPFSSPQPTREVSLVHSRVFYKDSILSALTHSIADSLPDKVHNFKKSKTKVISIK
jgi:LysR family hydrogen peroxide-inducible transcriptional activator